MGLASQSCSGQSPRSNRLDFENATSSRLPCPNELDSIRFAPGWRNLLTWPSAVLVHSWFDLCGRCGLIHGNDTSTSGAASQKRLMVLIERKIPEDYTLCPVARGADDQLHLLLKKLPFLPFAAGTLGQQMSLSGKRWCSSFCEVTLPP